MIQHPIVETGGWYQRAIGMHTDPLSHKGSFAGVHGGDGLGGAGLQFGKRAGVIGVGMRNEDMAQIGKFEA